MAAHNIKSVVDVGCGDWQFSHMLNWTGIDYTGFDVASTVIAADLQKYAANDTSGGSITFKVGSATEVLPQADLLIIKDVLQHLPNSYVFEFINTNLYSGRFKYMLFTTDLAVSGATANVDIAKPGLYREIDLRGPPYNVANLQEVYVFPPPSKQHTFLYTGNATLR